MHDWHDPTTPAPSSPQRGIWFFGAALLLLLIAAAAAFGLMAVLSLQPRTLTLVLQIDGHAQRISTTRVTVAEVLADANVTLTQDTRVDPPLEARLEDGQQITVSHGHTVALTVNGLTSVFTSLEDNPYTILQQAGVTLAADDAVWVNDQRIDAARLLEYPLPATRITVRRAVTLTLEDDGSARSIRTTAQTVGDALSESGVTLYLGDSVTPPVSASLADGLTVRITRSSPVSITVDGVTLESRARGAKVADALSEAGVILTGMDYSVPPENANLRPGMAIRVVRVTEERLTEQIPVPYETLYEADAELELDQRAVRQAGVNGLDERVIRVRYENGVEIRRYDEGVRRVQEPNPEIVRYGTKIVIRVAQTADGPIEYWRKLRLYATSYHPAALGGDNVTATGKILRKGIVGIDPKLIPYGTRLYVAGYGYGEAADTGAPRANRYWIDLGYEDHDWEHWAGMTDVYLVPPVPDKIIYLLP